MSDSSKRRRMSSNRQVNKTPQLNGFYNVRTWVDLPFIWLQWPFREVLGMLSLIVLLGSVVDCNENSAIDWPVLCPHHFHGFQLGETERKIMFAISIWALFNVSESFINSSGAKRHRSQLKGNQVLCIHIIAGTISVLGTGLAGILGGVSIGGKAFWFLAINDWVHQLCFIILMKNMDGIWALRAGSMAGLLFKFSVIMNYRYHTRYITDLLFQSTFGFAATRLSATVALLVIGACGCEKSSRKEDWYSIAMSIAHFHSYIRIPNAEVLALLSLPLTSYFFYHELWRNKWKFALTIFNAIYAVMSLMYLKTPNQRYASLLLYYLLCAFPPRFYRSPEKAISAAMAKAMSVGTCQVVMSREERLFD